MAEIGLVSSIIALAGAGAKLGIQLYAIADSVGSAGKEARMIAAEVSIFSQSLTALSKTLERWTSESNRLQEIAQSLLGGCQAVLLQLSELTTELAPVSYGKHHYGTVMSLVARVKWLLQKPKVEFIRRSIDSFRSTLILLVTSMDYTEALDRKAPEEIRDSLRTQVETLVQTAKDANASLVQSQQPTSETDLHTQHISGAASIAQATLSECLLIDFGDDIDARSESQTSSDLPKSTIPAADNRSLQLAITCTSIVHTQQLVLSLARDALERRQIRSNWSWQQTDDMSEAERDSHEVRSEGRDSVFSSLPSLENQSKTQHESISADIPTTDGAWSYVEDASDDETPVQAPKTPSVGSYTVHPSSSMSDKAHMDHHSARLDNLEKLLQSMQATTSAEQLRSTRHSGNENDQERITRLEESIQAFINDKNRYRQGTYGQTHIGQDAYGQVPYGQTPYGNPSFGPAGFGHMPYNSAPYSTSFDTTLRQNNEPTVKRNDELEALKQLLQKQEQDRIVREFETVKRAEAEAAAAAAKQARENEEIKKNEEMAAAVQKVKEAAEYAAFEAAQKTKKLEEEIARLKPEPDSIKAPVRFKDAVGRKFSFPFHLCKTWKGMEALIKQAFLHVDLIGEHVSQGHYDLTGPDGEIILPQVWDKMIQPDWEITQHLWPMPEPQVQTEKAAEDAAALSDPFAGLGLSDLGLMPPPPPLMKEPKPKKKKASKAGPSLDASISMDGLFPLGDISPPPKKKDPERRSVQSLDGKISGDSKRKWYKPSFLSRNSSTAPPNDDSDVESI